MSIDSLIGEKIKMRLASEADAEFILSLRQDSSLSKYISPTDISIEQQKKWLENYKIREKLELEYYFIVENLESIPVGTVRIYNINYEKRECVWGSFILSVNRPDKSSYEVIELSIEFIKNHLKLKKVNLDVRKNNSKAIYVYEKMGFIRTKEDEMDYFYEYNL